MWRNEADGLDWTYLSPAAEIGPGERTGKYRTTGDQLLVDSAGKSVLVILFEDVRGRGARRAGPPAARPPAFRGGVLMVPLSVLDLAPIVEGGDAAQSLRNSLDLARHAERLGLPPLLAGRAPQHAGHRQRRHRRGDRPCRRRHVDHPGRRRRDHAAEPRAAGDRRAVRHAGVALSRADRPRARPRPGSDQLTARALRRTLAATPTVSRGRRRAAGLLPAGRSRASWCAPCPARGSTCRSGSSGRACSARSWRPRSACRSPSPRTSRRPQLMQALDALPRALPALGPARRGPTSCSASTSFAADTDDEARLLLTSLQQAFVNLRRGRPGRCRRRSTAIDERLARRASAMLEQVLACSVVGSPETVRRAAGGVRRAHRADELIVTAQIFDHAARLRSYELTAEATTAAARRSA